MVPGLPQIGGVELIILLCIILLFFGAKGVPSLAGSLGGGISEFRKGASGQYEEVEQEGITAAQKGKAGPPKATREAEDGVLAEQKKF